MHVYMDKRRHANSFIEQIIDGKNNSFSLAFVYNFHCSKSPSARPEMRHKLHFIDANIRICFVTSSHVMLEAEPLHSLKFLIHQLCFCTDQVTGLPEVA